MFDLMLVRLQLDLGKDFTRKDMFQRFFPRTQASDFLDYTWGKPRDIIRFFRAAKDLFPRKASLSAKEYAAALRSYSNFAWQDVRAALTAFVPVSSLPILEDTLRQIAKDRLDGSRKYSYGDMSRTLRSTHEHMKKHGVTYSIDEFIKLLYVIGIFYMQYTDANRQIIFHQFHRGNHQPTKRGTVYMHYALARSFS